MGIDQVRMLIVVGDTCRTASKHRQRGARGLWPPPWIDTANIDKTGTRFVKIS